MRHRPFKKRPVTIDPTVMLSAYGVDMAAILSRMPKDAGDALIDALCAGVKAEDDERRTKRADSCDTLGVFAIGLPSGSV